MGPRRRRIIHDLDHSGIPRIDSRNCIMRIKTVVGFVRDLDARNEEVKFCPGCEVNRVVHPKERRCNCGRMFSVAWPCQPGDGVLLEASRSWHVPKDRPIVLSMADFTTRFACEIRRHPGFIINQNSRELYYDSGRREMRRDRIAQLRREAVRNFEGFEAYRIDTIVYEVVSEAVRQNGGNWDDCKD